MYSAKKLSCRPVFFMMNNKNLNFILAGCGRIAHRHAEQIQQYGTLKAVCDIIPEKAASFAAAHQCKAYTRFEEMLSAENETDVVVICTPNGLHAEQTIMALNKGMHVLCEKPMAVHSEECRAMMKAAEQNNRKLFVVKQNRYNPPVEAVKKLLDEKALGQIFSIQLNCFWNRGNDYYTGNWRGTKQLDGGTLFTQFSHFIDLLYWFFGDIKIISAAVDNYAHQHSIEFEDAGVVIFRSAGGALGTIHFTINSYLKNMEGSITIFAENGTIKIGGQYLNELEYQCIKGLSIKDLPMGNGANNYGTYTGSMSNHDKVYSHVADVLLNNLQIQTNAADAMKTVEIIEAAYGKAENLERKA